MNRFTEQIDVLELLTNCIKEDEEKAGTLLNNINDSLQLQANQEYLSRHESVTPEEHRHRSDHPQGSSRETGSPNETSNSNPAPAQLTQRQILDTLLDIHTRLQKLEEKR